MRYLSLIILVGCAMACPAQPIIKNLRIENLHNPIGLDLAKPRFSWQLEASKRNVAQTAYEIRVSNSKNKVTQGNVWNTGKVASDQSLYIDYGGTPLTSATTYFWQARVWDNSGKVSDWSTLQSFQTGLFSASDWKAQWIKVGFIEDTTNRPCPLFRKQFSASKQIASATAFITAHGLYEATLNGKRVGNAYLTPGWTSYNKRLQYQAYDVTPLLSEGQNAIGIMLGNGWYRGFIGFSGQKDFYGKELALLFQLKITYVDGTSEIISSDNSWKCSTGSITTSEIYNGETIDARKEKVNWATTNFNDSDWAPVATNVEAVNLVGTYNEPIRKHETFKASAFITTPKGERVLDFGQNLVGWVQVKVKGNAGDKVTLYHAEVLDKLGNFYTENLRPAKQKNEYILKGGAEETFEPHFTFQGFRYLKIESNIQTLKPENFTAIALYSDMKPTGSFTTSNNLINQLQHNIEWGQRGNFLDVPTDCPQRDERLGWTGDAQAFSRTATFNFDVHNFFAKWLKDLEADQVEGSVPFVIPNVLKPWGPIGIAGGSAGWADAATIIPWNMYVAYGDKQILETQYQSMKAWVGYMERNSTNYLWNTGFHFGDWLFYRPFDDNDGRAAVTDKYLIAQTFFAHSTQLVINTAKLLGKNDDVKTYSALLQNVKEAFVKEYLTPNGRLVSSTQTAYVLALNFDMLPEALRAQAAKKLADNVASYDNHLTTGFLGTPYLCDVLSRFGYADVAYKLLLQEIYPSWLYPVKMGATTIWERWDGIKPDSTFQTPGMNSFNHYAYGAIGDWMYRTVAGIDTYLDGVGYKHIQIKPTIGGSLTDVNASYETLYGKVTSHWKSNASKITLEVEIPPNTKASIFIPVNSVEELLEGGQPILLDKGIKIVGKENSYIEVEVGSGKYKFLEK